MSDSATDSEDNQSFLDFSEDDQTPILCLFCQMQTCNVAEAFEHMASEHGFSFHQLRSQFNLEFLQCIALLNYLRSRYSNESGLETVNVSTLGWSQILTDINADLERWLVPVVEHDRLLYEFDNDFADEESSDIAGAKNNQHVQESRENHEVAELRKRNAELTSLLQRLTLGQPESAKSKINDTAIPSVNDEEDLDYYFSGYSDIYIHETMLKDRIRTDAYRDFIYMNKSLFAGKVVMDVGCGTGILSMFASRAGASKVYAIDNSRMIDLAKEIAAKNGIDNIHFIRGKVEEINVPEPVDIIISEWMGYALLFEGMLDTVLYARDNFLRAECSQNVFPNNCDIFVAGVEDGEYQMEKFGFWNDVYGFDMSCVPKKYYRKQAIIDLLSDPRPTQRKDANGQIISESKDDDILITNTVMLRSIDCTAVTVKQLDFESSFSLECTRDGTLYAICMWFDSMFDGPQHNVVMSTSPLKPATHWKQTLLQLKDPIQCEKGQLISGLISVRKAADNPRNLDISLRIDDSDLNIYEEYALQ